MAVGPDHVIQTVNKAVQILDRNGTLMLSASLEDFFDVAGRDGSGNARVIFDALHQRWVMTQASWDCTAADGIGYIDYLVSSTADPTDPWRLDSLQINHFLPDSPAMGTSTVNLAFAANYFLMGPNCFGSGFKYYATDIAFFDWADVIRPPSAPDSVYDEFFFAGSGVDGHYSFFGARVAVQTPATSATVHAVVQYDNPADDPAVHTKVPAYFAFAGSAGAMNVNVTAVAELNASEVVSPFVEPPDPIQPGGVAIVTTLLDSHPTDAIWQSNKLTWVSTSGCDPAGGIVENRDCVRVTQVDTSPAHLAVPPAPIQDFLIARANTDNYVGGIGQALDGTLHVVWTRSSTTRYPSSYTAYQARSDPDNSLSIPALLKSGVDPGVQRQQPLGRLHRRRTGSAGSECRLAGEYVFGRRQHLEDVHLAAPDGRQLVCAHPAGPGPRHAAGIPDRPVGRIPGEHAADVPGRRRGVRHPEQRDRGDRQRDGRQPDRPQVTCRSPRRRSLTR